MRERRTGRFGVYTGGARLLRLPLRGRRARRLERLGLVVTKIAKKFVELIWSGVVLDGEESIG